MKDDINAKSSHMLRELLLIKGYLKSELASVIGISIKQLNQLLYNNGPQEFNRRILAKITRLYQAGHD